MKKLAKISALLFAVVLIATGCKKLPEFTDGSGSTPVTPTVDEPTVTTTEMTEINATYAICGGSVVYSGSTELTAVGFCWSENTEPTISDNHSIESTSAGSFVGKITNLTPHTKYYIRAYATNANGTYYGNLLSFTTLENGGGEAPTGAINGLFSVSETKQVYFSKGNLQYQASTNTWRFAENQYDHIGNANANISSSYDGWIDLFGWGTSGYNHGAVCYQPWSTSQTTSDYYAYGNSIYNLNSQTGKADWGYNKIINGGNKENTWRTPTKDEWVYILNTRVTSSGIRYAKAKVNGINGVVLLPDNWSNSIYSLNDVNDGGANYSSNIIDLSIWINTFETNGTVFLPTSGFRVNASIDYSNTRGCYQSSTQYNSDNSYYVYFYENAIFSENSDTRKDGLSVRLVHDAN